MEAMETGVVLGVDVGATKIRYGFVTPDGRILNHAQYPTSPMQAQVWCAQLMQQLDLFLAEHLGQRRLLAIGIGVKGSVDHRLHRLRSSSVILEAATWDICADLQQHYQVPVFLENDVKASALRELYFGIGKQKDTFACINVGTGLAMGLVLEGKLIHGIHNNAGEIGNLLYHRLDDGTLGFLETVSSGRGLEQEAMRLRNNFPPNSPVPSSKALVQACQEGDPAASQVVQNMLHHLALTLINLDTAMDIGTYVMVGGVMADPWILTALEEEILRITSSVSYNIFGWHADIFVSNAGADYAGLIGAASIAFYQSSQME